MGELAEPHAMSLAAISKHIHILARAGPASAQERAGGSSPAGCCPTGLRAAGIWLQGVGGFDAEDYDTLEKFLAGVLGEEAEEG